MRTPRLAELWRLVPLAILAAGATILAVGAGVSRAPERTLASAPAAWRGLAGAPRPRVDVGQRMLVVLKEPSLASRVAAAGGRATDAQERRWTAAAVAAQQQLLTTLAAEGVRIRPEFHYARVLNGFSAALDAPAISLLERRPEVAGVYPVRVAYPASIASEELARGAAERPGILLPGYDGRGVTIALLDTGVDRAHPYLRGRVADGINTLPDRDFGALAGARPGDPTRLERHGTELAGLLVGSGGPAGLAGVAGGASVLPIRIAGWQPDLTGGWAVYSRTDQLIAGLERAVDPNQDGDAHDAARVALVGVAAPYAPFADAPEARAVEGATRLDTLVVAPVGNDGPAGAGYGSVSSPGGAAAALTVAAADLRRNTAEVRAAVRVGLRVLFDRTVPLVGAVVPEGRHELPLAAPAGSASTLSHFFGHGLSRVAGRAALIPAGEDPAYATANAAAAGAAAVALYGSSIPAGALGLDERVSIPVVTLPGWVARRALAELARGRRPAIALGDPKLVPKGGGAIAPFSSRGIAFDGTVKPDLAAPGVALLTSDPGDNEDGSARFGTVNGSSAAAALVAGAAAVLAQARPALDAPELASLLTGYARPAADAPVAEQGNGLVELGASAAAELGAEPQTLAFGEATSAGWHETRTVTLRNLSTRPLRVRIGAEQGGGAGLAITARPRRVLLRRHASAVVRLTARLSGRPGSDATPAEGAVRFTPDGGMALRIPWLIPFGPAPTSLLQSLRLSARSFRPSDTRPAVLTFRAGRVVSTPQGPDVLPLARLDVELHGSDGRTLGLLARLRDVLPGRYAFGLTGRDPFGNTLLPGSYTLRLVAVPTAGGPPTRRTVPFSIR